MPAWPLPCQTLPVQPQACPPARSPPPAASVHPAVRAESLRGDQHLPPLPVLALQRSSTCLCSRSVLCLPGTMEVRKPHLLCLLSGPVVVLGCHAGFQVLHSFNPQLLYLARELWDILVAQLLSPAQLSVVAPTALTLIEGREPLRSTGPRCFKAEHPCRHNEHASIASAHLDVSGCRLLSASRRL